MVDCTQAKEFALAHWLVNGADGGRLFVRCFGGDGTVRENVVGDVLASLTTMVWNAPSKSWTGGATMADASLNRRMTVRLADAVAFAQIGSSAWTGRSSGVAAPVRAAEASPALLCGTRPAGRRARIRGRDPAGPPVARTRRRALGGRRGEERRASAGRRADGIDCSSLVRLAAGLGPAWSRWGEPQRCPDGKQSSGLPRQGPAKLRARGRISRSASEGGGADPRAKWVLHIA